MASAFVGRTREISRLEELGTGVLVTLWGPGGVGKTRLAKEHASEQLRRGRNVVWADLAAARSRRELLATLAASLGVALAARSEEDLEALARAACAQRAMLIADNVEQLDADARDALVRVTEAIMNDDGASVLVTSRELLGATGEIGIAVSPLAEEDGLALFTLLAGEGASGAPAAARAIVNRLDALPLAIELAAARAPLLGVAELLARLDRKLDVLGTAKDDRPVRHATLRAAIAWSWDLLDDAEREALMACSMFEAPFDAALAEQVIGGSEAEALDRLERLRRRALVHGSVDGGRTTLRLLESVRDFAREASAATGDDEARRHRHAAAVVSRSEPLAEASSCGRDALGALEALRADLESASRSGGEWSTMARATLALASLYAISGPASAAVETVEAVLDARASPRAGGRTRRRAEANGEELLLAKLLVAKGEALRALGKHVDARTVLVRAQAAAAQLGGGPEVRLVKAEATRVLGSVLRALGAVDEALEQKTAALASYRAIGDRAREGICLGEIGAVYQSEGRLALAKTFHAEAIAIHKATGSRRAEGVERSYLAVATHRAGDPAASIALHDRAMAIHREVGHRRLEGAEQLHLGFVHHELGALAAARDAFDAARGMLAAAGARGLEAIALIFAARLEVDAGDTTTALLRLAEASQAAPAVWPRVAATRHLVEGHLALATGAPAKAQASYEASLATSRDLEVGFEALTPAYLAVAVTRSRRAAPAVRELLADARERVAVIENPHLPIALEVLAACAEGRAAPDVPSSASAASSEVRRALGLSGAPRALVIDVTGKRVVLPDGRVVDLSRRKNVRLVLLALARARCDEPGAVVLPDALLEAGWAGERMRSDAATKRLHTAIWTLRSLGFEAVLLTEGEGYLLDPRINLVLADA